MRALAFLLAAQLTTGNGAVAADVPIVAGVTAASERSVESIIKTLRASVCNQIESIKVNPVPDYFTAELPSPVDPIFLASLLQQSTKLEAWTVVGCGRKTVAILALSNETNGAEHYRMVTPQGWYDGP
jgi:hypothetical protein